MGKWILKQRYGCKEIIEIWFNPRYQMTTHVATVDTNFPLSSTPLERICSIIDCSTTFERFLTSSTCGPRPGPRSVLAVHVCSSAKEKLVVVPCCSFFAPVTSFHRIPSSQIHVQIWRLIIVEFFRALKMMSVHLDASRSIHTSIKPKHVTHSYCIRNDLPRAVYMQ